MWQLTKILVEAHMRELWCEAESSRRVRAARAAARDARRRPAPRDPDAGGRAADGSDTARARCLALVAED